MSLVEAAASQLPVVATRVGGMPEIIEEGVTGLLVAANDPVALAEAILTLLRDEGKRRAMGQAARRRAERLFNWQRITDSLWRCYQQL